MMTKKSFRESLPAPDRCKALRAYVERGGALVMGGGFMSFTGIEGKARYGVTPIADVLPVRLLPRTTAWRPPRAPCRWVLRKDHPIFQGLPDPWPYYFIGYNRTIADPERGEVLATINGDPFVAVGRFGKGRSAVFTSDCAPHWAPPSFLASPDYGKLWKNIADWATQP